MTRRTGKRKLIFAKETDEIEYREVITGAKRKKMPPLQYIKEVNRLRESIGKKEIFPPGSMSILSNKMLFMPTKNQSELLNKMSKRLVEKGKFNNVSEVARELGKENSSTLNEQIKNMKKKGFPVEIFFKEKTKKGASNEK